MEHVKGDEGTTKRRREEKDEEQEEDEGTSRSTTSGGSGSSDDEEEEGLHCSLVVAGQRRCSGLLTATARALRFVPHSDPDHVYEVEYGRVMWAGWQASERGSRGENCGFLHLELTKSSSPDVGGDSSTKGQRRKKKTKSGGGDSVDDLGRHAFAHFVAGGPRNARNPRLRAIVADIGRLSAVALAAVATEPTDATATTPPPPTTGGPSAAPPMVIAASSPSPRGRRTRSTVVIGSDGEDDRVEGEEIEKEKKEEEEVGDEEDEDGDSGAGIRVERIGHRGTEAMHGVVRGGAGMCRVHLTPTAIVQLDRRPFVVVLYREIEVACLERALFKPALRNFDLALVKKSVRQQVPTTKPKLRRKGRVTRKSSRKKRRRGEDDETDDDEEDEDVIGGKNLSRYVAQIHSIPMEYLARLESRLSDEAVPHHRGLGNVQWPPLLNFVRDNPEEFERTGGWAQYLKPEHGEGACGRRRKRGSDDSDDGSEDDDDDSSDSEGDLWTMSGSGGDDDDEESDGEFTPEAGLLNASYSEIDEADDADSPRSKRKRKRLPSATVGTSSGEKKRSDTSPGLAALLLQVSDDEDVHLASIKTTKRKVKAKPKKTTRAGGKLDDKRAKTKVSKGKGDDGEPEKKRRRRATTKGDEGKEQAVAKVSTRRKRTSEGAEETKSASKAPRVRTSKKKKKSEDCGEKDAKAKAEAKTTRCLALEESIIESTDDEFEPKAAKPAAASSAAESARARNERVRQRRFTGYNTRSRRGATSAGGPQDKIIRIDPPPTRRKRSLAPPTAGNGPQQSQDLEESPPKKKKVPAMKAEAEVVDSAASTQTLMLRPTVVAASDDGDESGSCSLSFNSGDESTGSALGEAGYEESHRSCDSTSTSTSPVAAKFPLAGVSVGLLQNAQ